MMSEPGKTLEIEDVLSSIRRLVSQDTVTPRAASAPPRPAPLSAEAQCLVLTPALRVETGEEAEEPASVEAAEDAPEAFDEAPFAEDVAEEVEPTAEVVEFSSEMPAETSAEIEDAVEPEMPAEAAISEPGMSETEALLRAAESALADSGVVLEDAGMALGGTLEDDTEEAEAETLGDELARLESTIAEMEAAVTGSEVEFEPEEGDRFEAEGAAPLVDLPENFDAEAFIEAAVSSEPAAEEAEEGTAEEETLSMAARFGSPAEIDEAEFVDEAPLAVAGTEGAEAGDVDPDLQDASWAGPDAGMDWAEAAISLAQPKTARRLHLSDAEEPAHRPEIRRSSYEDMRAEFERDSDFDTEVAGQTCDEPLIDEETLRAMVAQMIREELRGTLGERITSNVRRLVRREIQRALMGQDFD